MASATPAAPAAPTPPSGPADNFASLRNMLVTSPALTQPAVPEPVPAGSTPVDTPAPVPAETAPTGSTPADSASTASTEPQPATSDHDSWVSRYGDPDRAAREAFDLEQRAAAMAKELKELKARAAQPAPAETTTTPQPPPTVAAEPAHPAPPPATEDIHQLALKAASADRVCCDLDAQYAKDETRLGELSAEIPKAASDIDYLNRRLAEVSNDPYQTDEVKDGLKAALVQAQLAKERLETEQVKLEVKTDTAKRKWQERYFAHRQRIESERKALKDREAAIHAVEQDAAEFASAVKVAFHAEFDAQKVDPEIKDEVFEAVVRSMDERADVRDVPRLVHDLIAAELRRGEKWHRVQSRHYAIRLKTEPAPTPTPAGSPAPAAAPVKDLSAHLDSLKQMTRQLNRVRRVGP